MTKLRYSNCDKTQKLKLWLNSKTQIVTKLKNSNCDNAQTLKLWQNSKTQKMTKLKNSNCDKSNKKKPKNIDKAQKLKTWQNSKTQIVTKPKNSNCVKTQKLKLLQITQNLKGTAYTMRPWIFWASAQLFTAVRPFYLKRNNGHFSGCSQLPDMLVVAAEGLVDVEQEDKVLGLLQMGLFAGTLEQLRGQQLRLIVM